MLSSKFLLQFLLRLLRLMMEYNLGSNDPFLPPGWFWLVFITATEAYQAGQAGGTGLTGRHCENTCVF